MDKVAGFESQVSKSANRRGGRKKGVPNKATAEVKVLAKTHGPASIAELARLSLHAENESARVAAIKELLDRAYGKSTTILAGNGDGGPILFARIELVPLG